MKGGKDNGKDKRNLVRDPAAWEGLHEMDILSCGAGMQSTALALMSCDNARNGNMYPGVPKYDAVLYCDLKCEPPWVYDQVAFIAKECEACGIPFYVLESDLYGHYIQNFGKARVVSIPFWSTDETGKKGRMMRNCTIDFRISIMQKFVKYNLLGYRPYQRVKPEDRKAHTMHIGFSKEEQQRIFDNPHPMFNNRFPLIEMGLERPDNYRYCLEEWGLKTKASACNMCPFHRNYFFHYLKEHCPESYQQVVTFDRLLEENQPQTKIRSKLYLSRSRKRIIDLTDAECQDAETFEYEGNHVWNGF